MNIELWDVQEHAVEKLYGRRGGLLWDDMGLGKTFTALAEIHRWVTAHPDAPLSILIVAKREAHEHWLDHIRRMLPAYEGCFEFTHWDGLLASYHEQCPDCDGEYAMVGGEEKCPTCKGKGYRIRFGTRRELATRKWTFLILDEGHRTRNRKAKQRNAVKQIAKRTEYVRFLSGTFVVGNIDDLWSPLNIMYPKAWGSYWRMYEEYVSYVMHNKGTCRVCGNQIYHQQEYREVLGSKNEAKLMRQIRPYTVGLRMKKGCECIESAPLCQVCQGTGEGTRILNDNLYTSPRACIACNASGLQIPHDHLEGLPDKQDPVHHKVDLSKEQRRAYDQMKEDALAWVGPDGDQPLPAPIVLTQLIRLRQFAGAYCHIDDKGKVQMAEPSAKLDALMGLIEDMPRDEPFVVFTISKKLLYLATARFEAAGVPYFDLHGDTPHDQRSDWRKFQAGERRAFIATIATGGESIELFRASTVIFLDRWWTNHANDQARDRLWRSGQKNAVLPIYIEARDTVDETDIPDTLALKASVVRKMIRGH